MNKNELLSVSKVMADPIFSSESNWFRVSFVFKHTTSNKRFVPSFKSFSGTKSLRIRSGMAVDDQFELKKIIISKSDRTHLVIKTSEIPSVSGYQFSLSSEGQQTGGESGGGQTFNGTYLKDFSASPELGEGEQLVQVVGGGFPVPFTVIENGNLVAYSNYTRYKSGFLVKKTSLNLEANTTYQIKLTGSVENTESDSAPSVGIVFGSNDGYSEKYVYDFQNNFLGSNLQSQHWVNGVAEFRVTTDSTITDSANFQLFKLVLSWVNGTGKLSISKIEITKV